MRVFSPNNCGIEALIYVYLLAVNKYEASSENKNRRPLKYETQNICIVLFLGRFLCRIEMHKSHLSHRKR